MELLKSLIRIQSVNPDLTPGGNGEEEIARFIGSYMESVGLLVRYQEVAPGRLNAIGVLKGTGGGRSLMLNGHIDTVDVEGMTIDPLDPVLKGDRLYGRGSFDMKGGVAAMIEAVNAVVDSGTPIRGDVVIACVCDEEYASMGTEAVVREYVTDAAIVTEPTANRVCVAHKGFAWATVEVTGKAAHGSLPSEGVDAIMGAGKFLSQLDLYARETLAARKHPLLGSPSVHASLIEGGSNLSTYPSRCVVKLERRTVPGEGRETVEREIEMVLQAVKEKDPQFQASADVFFTRPPFEVSTDEPVVRAVSEAVSETLGRKVEYVGSHPWLDSAILAGAGVPTVILGPDGYGAHGAVEYVHFPSVVDTARVLFSAISKIAG